MYEPLTDREIELLEKRGAEKKARRARNGMRLIWSTVALAFACIGFCAGYSIGCSEIRKQAINMGVAQWKADPKTGETWFDWERGLDKR